LISAWAPLGVTHSAPPDPLLDSRGPTSKGKREKGREVGRGGARGYSAHPPWMKPRSATADM